MGRSISGPLVAVYNLVHRLSSNNFDSICYCIYLMLNIYIVRATDRWAKQGHCPNTSVGG